MSVPKQATSGNSLVIELFDGNIEIFNDWFLGKWDIDSLIDNAEIIDGIRFGRLDEVVKWKKMMSRPKDLEHIKMIEDYLAKNGNI